MVIISGKIGSGKTYELLKLAYKNKGTVVTHSRCYAEELMRMSAKWGIPVNAISYEEYSRYFTNLHSSIGCARCDMNFKFYIDQIEVFLDYLTKGTVAGFICDGENIVVKKKVNGEYLKYDLV